MAIENLHSITSVVDQLHRLGVATQDGCTLKFTHEASQMTFSFARSKRLSLPGLATLALIIRRLAEEGHSVTVALPSHAAKRSEDQYFYLANSGFVRLFEQDYRSELSEWKSNIKLRNRWLEADAYVAERRSQQSKTEAHYVPLTFFDSSTMLLPPTEDIHVRNADFRPDFARDMRRRLADTGEMSEPDLDVLMDVVMLETVSNAIQHSAVAKASAVGVFAAQFGYQTDHNVYAAQLVVADIGLGIPATLRQQYLRNHELPASPSPTASEVIKYAFVNGSSRLRDSRFRPVNLSRLRGLARLPAHLRDGSLVTVRSGPGHYQLHCTATIPRDDLPQDGEQAFCPGTQLAITVVLADATDREEAHGAPGNAIRAVLPPDGGGAVETGDDALNGCGAVATVGRALWLDVCCVAPSVETLCRAIAQYQERVESVLILNLPSHHATCDLGAATGLAGALRPVYLATDGRLRPLGGEATGTFGTICDSVLLAMMDAERKSRAVRNWARAPLAHAVPRSGQHLVMYEANTQYLEYGFRSLSAESGFYIGNVLLLSGTAVGRFFALGSNMSNCGGRQYERWCTSLAFGLEYLTELLGEIEKPILLSIGRAASSLLRDVRVCSLDGAAIATVMSFDVPSREELEHLLGSV